jgi:hypothetical protein
VKLAFGPLFLALGWGWPAAAPAQEPRLPTSLEVTGSEGGCPAAADVASKLARLLPGVAVTAAAAGPAGEARGASGGARVLVEDLGDSFRVSVAGATREMPDGARRCAERGHRAAVVAALALAPPRVDLPQREDPPGPGAPLSLLLEAAGTLATAPGNGGLWTGGGALRLSAQGERLGASLGAELTAPATMDLAGARARIGRLSLDLSGRALWQGRSLHVGLDLGVAATVLWVEGRDVPAPAQATRLEPGLRAAAFVQLSATGRLMPYLALEAVVAPRRYDLVVEPGGVVGKTPWLWVGGLAGVAFRMR